jgi:hypothetical protein
MAPTLMLTVTGSMNKSKLVFLYRDEFPRMEVNFDLMKLKSSDLKNLVDLFEKRGVDD